MPIRTRLTERPDLRHPIVLAPMALVSGGALASAVHGNAAIPGKTEWL
jgi:nitronate monooxygenase